MMQMIKINKRICKRKEPEDEIVYAVRTQLPDKKLLSEKLQQTIAIAKERYANAVNNWSLEVWNSSKITGKCVIL